MISVVVPAFNEAAVIELLHARLTAAAETWREDYEIILVDDGSGDETRAICRKIARADPHFSRIELGRSPRFGLALWGSRLVILSGGPMSPLSSILTVLTIVLDRHFGGSKMEMLLITAMISITLGLASAVAILVYLRMGHRQTMGRRE